LAIDVGVAATGNAGRGEFEDIGIERLTSGIHSIEAKR
jgi:hypothetical protein